MKLSINARFAKIVSATLVFVAFLTAVSCDDWSGNDTANLLLLL
jgi:hypothetical protein